MAFSRAGVFSALRFFPSLLLRAGERIGEVNVGSVCHPVLLGLVMQANAGDTNNKRDSFI